jgi:hypothetical protein
MPEILDRCVTEVMGKGHDESSAYAICRTSLGLKSDGTEDEIPSGVTDEQMRARVTTAMQFQNGPSLIKDMVVCGPMGKFVNGDQHGVMSRSRLSKLADNFKKYPRQVPVFMLGDHPETNDDASPVGWVEGLSMDGGDLKARTKLHGPGASAVGGDLIRGASIFTVQGKNPDGTPQGEVLKHLLLTNEPFYKNLNVAATQAAESAVCVFTALPKKEAVVAETEKDQEIARLNDEVAALKAATPDEKAAAQLKETGILLAEKIRENAELTASNENLKGDVERFKSPKAIEELTLQLKQEQRQNRASKVRRLVTEGVAEGQFTVALVGHPKSGYNHPSDEMVLSWFKQSIFKDDFTRLDVMLETMPKQRIGRTFGSGEGAEKTETAMTDQDKEFIRSLGQNPEKVMAAMKAKDAKAYAAAIAK